MGFAKGEHFSIVNQIVTMEIESNSIKIDRQW